MKKETRSFLLAIVIGCIMMFGGTFFAMRACNQVVGEVHKTGLKNIVNDIWEGKK